jgi:hypothetical protein
MGAFSPIDGGFSSSIALIYMALLSSKTLKTLKTPKTTTNACGSTRRRFLPVKKNVAHAGALDSNTVLVVR